MSIKCNDRGGFSLTEDGRLGWCSVLGGVDLEVWTWCRRCRAWNGQMLACVFVPVCAHGSFMLLGSGAGEWWVSDVSDVVQKRGRSGN